LVTIVIWYVSFNTQIHVQSIVLERLFRAAWRQNYLKNIQMIKSIVCDIIITDNTKWQKRPQDIDSTSLRERFQCSTQMKRLLLKLAIFVLRRNNSYIITADQS
jgi:hypothetical protein